MHWSEKIAKELIAKNPNKEKFVCASGISPSGTVHSGNLREFLTTYFVVEALKSLGKKAEMIFSWDDFDRLRKVPKNVAIPGFENNIGKPYSEIPAPYGGDFESYADYFEKEFGASLSVLNTPCRMIFQNKMYKGGKYSNQIIDALKHRKEIYDIIMSFKTQESTTNDRENFYPVSVYCSKCGKDSTTVIKLSSDCTKLTYLCECGFSETVDITNWHMLKLQWKIDWPMRWIYEGVAFEPGGKDHSTVGGSYDVSSKIIRDIWGKEPPQYQKYDWIGISNVGEMHSSSGINMSPEELLKVYEPSVFMWLYAKYDPEDPFNFAYDQTIQRQYADFDKMLDGYIAGTLDEYNTTVMKLALNGRPAEKRIGFGTLVNISQLANFDRKLIQTMVEKLGFSFNDGTIERLSKAEYWIKTYGEPETFELLSAKNVEFFNTLNDDEKLTIANVAKLLQNADKMKDSEIQQSIYDIVNKPELTKKENMAIQQGFFKNVYNLLFGSDKGPRLYMYFACIDKNKYLPLLQF